MKNSARSRFSDNNKVISNPHFWIITGIVLILTFVYYSHFFIIQLVDPRWNFFWRLVYFEFINNINCGLFYIPFIYAAIIFWWRGILITWLLSMIIMMPRIRYLSPDITSFVTNIFFLITPLLVVIIAVSLKKWKDTERLALIKREEERQAYLSEIINAQEDERKRIAREIHDDTTQRLWVLANRIKDLEKKDAFGTNPAVLTELEEIKDATLRISDDARRLSVALRPGILDDLGLVPAIRWIVDRFNSEGNIKAEIEFIDRSRHPFDHETSTHLFRIIQEALNNVKRHSEATQVSITLENAPNTIKLTIQDNGKGLPKDINKVPEQDKLGIIGMQERVRLLDGKFNIRSQNGRGTIISVQFRNLPASPEISNV